MYVFRADFVDVLGAGFEGGWEEIGRSLEMFEYFNLDDVVVFILNHGLGWMTRDELKTRETHDDSEICEESEIGIQKALRKANSKDACF